MNVQTPGTCDPAQVEQRVAETLHCGDVPEPWHEAVRNVDVVRAPAFIADQALPRLGDETGAVIRDAYLHRVYWLLPPESTREWIPLRHVETYGPDTSIDMPPAGLTTGVRRFWQVSPGPDRLLTDPELLHDVLTPLVLRAYGPVEPRR